MDSAASFLYLGAKGSLFMFKCERSTNLLFFFFYICVVVFLFIYFLE